MKNKLILMLGFVLLVLVSSGSVSGAWYDDTNFSTDANDYLVYNVNAVITGDTQFVTNFPSDTTNTYSCIWNLTDSTSWDKNFAMFFKNATDNIVFGSALGWVNANEKWNIRKNDGWETITTDAEDEVPAFWGLEINISALTVNYTGYISSNYNEKVNHQDTAYTDLDTITYVEGDSGAGNPLTFDLICWNGTLLERPELAPPPPGTAPTVTAHVTSPATVYTNTDFKFNMTATDPDNATFTGYVQFYINGSVNGSEISQAMNNNTNTLIGTLANANFIHFSELIVEYWAGDGEENTTKANQSIVTVSNTAPTQPTLTNPADNGYLGSNTYMNWSASTDADLDTINYYVLVNGTQACYTTSLNCSYSAPTDSYYQWNVTPFDGTVNGTTSTSRYFTFESVAPTPSEWTPPNTTFANIVSPIVGILITDGGSGVDNSTVSIEISNSGGAWINVTGSSTKTGNSSNIIVRWGSGSYSEGDNLSVRVNAHDNVKNVMTETQWWFVIDITAPTITPDGVINLNKTFATNNNVNITAQINATDPYLYSINVTINGSSILNIGNLNQTLYVYNLSQNVSAYSAGVYNITFRTCDGHTANKLKEKWDYNIGLLGLTFKDNKKWYRINPTNMDLFESISTNKFNDRYDFRYRKSWIGRLLSKEDTYTFIVESSDDIEIVSRTGTEYNAWLVIPTIGLTGRWIDFNLKGIPNAKYTVERIDNKKVKVTISNIPKGVSELVFESTGELNCNTETYLWYKSTHTETYNTIVLETSSQTYILNTTRDLNYIDNGTTVFNWNGTEYNITGIVNDTYIWFTKTLTMPDILNLSVNITFNWTYTLVGNENITTNTITHTQIIYDLNFDNCSIYSVVALNFSLFEESNNASIAGNMDFTFSLIKEDVSINYSKSVTGVNSTAFCIPTTQASFTAQMHSEYTATNYDAHTYFAYNLAITNTTNYILFYLTNGTTIVEFTVLDQNGDTLKNAYIKIKKYDIGTNVYKTIEVLKTDGQGKALGNIVLDTAWYEFVIEYSGTVYLTDGPTKMTSTTRTFRINLLTDFFAQYTDVLYNIVSTLNYTDVTGNFRFTWSNPDGNYHYGCLKVQKESLAGNTLIDETCVASTAGTILINVNSSGNVNGTYVAVGYILFDEPYVLRILRMTWGSLSEKFGKEGLFYGFLIILTLACVGIFNPKVAIILAVIGLVFSSILGFFHLNPSWVVALVIAAGLTVYRMRD